MRRDTTQPYEPSNDFYIDTSSYRQPKLGERRAAPERGGPPSTSVTIDKKARADMIDKAINQFDENKERETLVLELASDLMTGKEIAYIDHDLKHKRLDIWAVVRRYQEMSKGNKFPFEHEALATLFGSNGEHSAQMINYGYKAAESLINEFYDSITTIRKESEDEIN